MTNEQILRELKLIKNHVNKLIDAIEHNNAINDEIELHSNEHLDAVKLHESLMKTDDIAEERNVLVSPCILNGCSSSKQESCCGCPDYFEYRSKLHVNE